MRGAPVNVADESQRDVIVPGLEPARADDAAARERHLAGDAFGQFERGEQTRHDAALLSTNGTRSPSPRPFPANGRGDAPLLPLAGEGGPKGRMRAPAIALFVREWRVARRIGGGAPVGAVFFLILVAVMPFALGPDLDLLARLGPAILWIAALLATLLGLDRLFQADHDDGSLDLLINGTLPLEVAVLIKCAAHWATSALPLIVASPLFGLMLGM